MEKMHAVLSTAFPWLVLSGLFLAGWGLIVTPDDIQARTELSVSKERPAAIAVLEGAWRNADARLVEREERWQ